MRLTIVKADNLTLIDSKPQAFDLSAYDLPEHFWALQWQDSAGEIEYDNGTDNQSIDDLPDWTAPIITEHQRLTEEQRTWQDQKQREAIFLQNGQARTDRIQRQQADRQAREQQQVNDYVRSIM